MSHTQDISDGFHHTLVSDTDWLDKTNQSKSALPPGDAEQYRQLYRQSGGCIVINLLTAVAVSWMLWSSAPLHLLVPWLMFVTSTLTIHVLLSSYYGKYPPPAGQLNNWATVYTFLTTVTGLSWGIGGILLMAGQELGDQLIFLSAVFVVLAVSVPVFGPVLRTFFLFASSALLPLLLWTLAGSNEYPLVISSMVILVGTGLTTGVLHYHYSLASARVLASEIAEIAKVTAQQLNEKEKTVSRLENELRAGAKSMEKEFDKKESTLAILRSIGAGIISTDGRGDIDYMNPAAETLTGWRFMDVRGRPLPSVLMLLESDLRKPIANPSDRCLETGEMVPLVNNTVLVRQDGLEYKIECLTTPVRLDNDVINGTVTVFQDVTENSSISEKLAW